MYQVETSGLYNHEEDENFRQDVDNDDDDDTVLDTRGLVTEHNKKKKKSGGFQSMGMLRFYEPKKSHASKFMVDPFPLSLTFNTFSLWLKELPLPWLNNTGVSECRESKFILMY